MAEFRLADDDAWPLRGVFFHALNQLAHLPRDVAFAEREITPACGQHVLLWPAEMQSRRSAITRHFESDGGNGMRHRRAVVDADHVAIFLADNLDHQLLVEIARIVQAYLQEDDLLVMVELMPIADLTFLLGVVLAWMERHQDREVGVAQAVPHELRVPVLELEADRAFLVCPPGARGDRHRQDRRDETDRNQASAQCMKRDSPR